MRSSVVLTDGANEGGSTLELPSRVPELGSSHDSFSLFPLLSSSVIIMMPRKQRNSQLDFFQSPQAHCRAHGWWVVGSL